MAGVLKARDTGGTLRTATALKARDAGGVLRTMAFGRVRQSDGTLKEFFTTGGGPGPGPGPNPTYISPGWWGESGKPTTGYHSFEARSSGNAPTSYSWRVTEGNAFILGATNQPTITGAVTSPGGFQSEVGVFECTMVVDGVTWSASCNFEYTSTI